MTTTRVQIVLVTGAGSGFGRATVIELARAGHVVYASMRRDDLEGHSKERWASLRSVASEERLDLRRRPRGRKLPCGGGSDSRRRGAS